jgi:hypothetical protein
MYDGLMGLKRATAIPDPLIVSRIIPAEDLSFQWFVSELQGNAFRFVQSKRQ